MYDSIDEVIARLDSIITESRAAQSASGYFPGLYKRVTTIVKAEIAAETFDDNSRMEDLVTCFAQRYLIAYDQFQGGASPGQSWLAAFEGTRNASLIVLQHLLLGMNAHIGFDLGISAAEVSDPSNPLSIRNDFLRINSILGSLVNDTQEQLTRFFGPLGILDRLFGPVDENLSLFSLEYARDKAWTQSLELLLERDEGRRQAILETRDAKVARFSKRIAHPSKRTLRMVLKVVRILEKGSVPWRIDVLNSASPPSRGNASRKCIASPTSRT